MSKCFADEHRVHQFTLDIKTKTDTLYTTLVH